MSDHHSYIHKLSSCEIKPEKKSGWNRTRTDDLCNIDAVLYQLSYQVNWQLVTLYVTYPQMVKRAGKYVKDNIFVMASEAGNLQWSQLKS